MNVIKGRAETHKDGTPVDEQGDLDVIRSRSTDIVALIEKVHTFIERISTDGNPDLTPIDLSSLLESEIEKARQAYPDAQITADIPADIRVLADEMLAEVFENLLINAVEHNDKETPEVTVSIENREDAAVVSVADNGPGILESQKEQIFAWNPESTSLPATGVGLSLVETLVDQYGGSIWIEDNDPDGSIFRVKLPVPGNKRSAAGNLDDQNKSSTLGTRNATDHEIDDITLEEVKEYSPFHWVLEFASVYRARPKNITRNPLSTRNLSIILSKWNPFTVQGFTRDIQLHPI